MTPHDPAPVLERFLAFSKLYPFIPVVGIVRSLAFYMELHFFTAFAKKTSRIGRQVVTAAADLHAGGAGHRIEVQCGAIYALGPCLALARATDALSCQCQCQCVSCVIQGFYRLAETLT